MGCFNDTRLLSNRKKMPELSEKEMKEVKEAFDLFDGDGSGNIDAKELYVAIQALGFSPTQEEVDTMVKDIDADGNATIEFNEFVDMMSGKMGGKDPVEELKKAFAMFDTEGKGKISFKDMQRVATEIGEAMKEGELQEVIDECGDGSGISEAAFIEIMKEQNLA